MNRKKIFSKSLYIEGIRQLKIIGFIFFIIYMLEAILIPLNMMQYDNVTPYSRMVGIDNMHPAIYLTFTVMAPIFTLYLFRFLTRRDSSDFYHSIPHTRTCLYISYIAAIITWILAVLFISSATSITIFLCNPKKFTINFSMVIPYLIGILIASIGVVCGIALAQCITGTMLTNIIVSGIILFFPRLFSTVIIQNIFSKTYSILSEEHFMTILNGKYNLITCCFLNGNFPNTNIFAEYSSWIYTAVLSIIYFAAGLYLFNKRKSESAGNSAPNKVIQAIYRICITLAFCLIPITIICQEPDYDFVGIFTIYCIAVVIYFLFEIITTKTVRNLLKILPGLIIIAVLNICTILFINTVSEHELNWCPEPAEVSYIKSVSDDSNMIFANFSAQDGYKFTDIISEGIEITDKDIIESTVANLKSNIQRYHSSIPYYYEEENQFHTFEIHMKNGSTCYRRINTSLSSDETLSQMISNYLSDNIEYEKALENLPKYNDVTINTSFKKVSKSQKNELYNAFLKDYDTLTTLEKSDLIENGYLYGYDNHSDSLGCMEIAFSIKSKFTFLYVPITQELPETFNMYINSFYDDAALKDAKNILSDVNNYVSVSQRPLNIKLANTNSNIYFNFYSEDYDYAHENSDEAAKILAELSEFIPDTLDEYKDNIRKGTKYINILMRDNRNDEEINVILLPETDETSKLYDILNEYYSKFEYYD